jgi:hypothetical protein
MSPENRRILRQIGYGVPAIPGAGLIYIVLRLVGVV